MPFSRSSSSSSSSCRSLSSLARAFFFRRPRTCRGVTLAGLELAKTYLCVAVLPPFLFSLSDPRRFAAPVVSPLFLVSRSALPPMSPASPVPFSLRLPPCPTSSPLPPPLARMRPFLLLSRLSLLSVQLLRQAVVRRWREHQHPTAARPPVASRTSPPRSPFSPFPFLFSSLLSLPSPLPSPRSRPFPLSASRVARRSLSARQPASCHVCTMIARHVTSRATRFAPFLYQRILAPRVSRPRFRRQRALALPFRRQRALALPFRCLLAPCALALRSHQCSALLAFRSGRRRGRGSVRRRPCRKPCVLWCSRRKPRPPRARPSQTRAAWPTWEPGSGSGRTCARRKKE